MSSRTPRRLLAAVATTGVAALTAAGTASPASASDNLPELVEQATAASERLLETAADRADLSLQEVQELVDSDQAIVGQSGVLSYTDRFEAPDEHDHEAADLAPAADVPGDPAGGSKPGAPYTVYLDFDGATVTNTEWNRYYQEDVFEFDANAAGSDADYVYQVWARVAEDFAPFDINVTTTDPGADALHKTSMDDAEYGMTAVVTDTTDVAPADQASGRAWLGGFGNQFYSPALIFAPVARDSNPSDVGNIVSHEVGHTFNLNHDGIGDDEYYGDTLAEPTSLWAPIMGAPWSAPLSQWDNGQYADTTNPEQDDLAEITLADGAYQSFMVFDGDQMWLEGFCTDAEDPNNPQPGDTVYKPGPDGTCNPPGEELTLQFYYGGRAAYAADDHSDSVGEGTALDNSSGDFQATGVIGATDERDVFELVTNGGPVSITAEPATVGPNVDLHIELIDSEGNIVAEANPETSTDIASSPTDRQANGLGASVEAEVETGVYSVRVSGAGQGDPASNTPSNGAGYTSYGSLGNYALTGSAPAFDADPITIISPENGDEVDPSSVEVTGSAEPGSTVTLSVGDGTVGTGTTDDEGTWSIVLEGDLPYGETTITAQQTVGSIQVPETAEVTVVVPVDAPTIVRPEEGDTATTATPTFSGEGVPGATVEVSIACGEDTWAGSAEVDEEGAWSFTPEESLPNGECSVTAVQTINGVTSPEAGPVNFTIDVSSGDENGDDGGEENGGDENGDEDGEDLPDTGASTNSLVMAAGLLLLGLGAVLYARTRRNVTG
ncbi:Ig-like domain-containing protein [Jiangella asiatica]|uniref:LPXTG cell wall anchor domain-containing protein n=1 Tax=Jiangella asiatica TaxID=2530372 RepID=A0A4R5D9Y8_9ACTN|nr:Ig-like domain-containing protein [Jiangella asiatica]TDE10389.1 LPXTG cell wall anchor domain-containing protein [Jiangella asiatica]